jgi:molybdopterin synthase catalytic subunit
MPDVLQAPAGDTWIGLTEEPLPVGAIHDWAVRPDCGAVVLFSGTVRDHAEGRTDVSTLTYEAYEEQATPRLERIDQELRSRWPDVGRVALLHRLGELQLGESSVVVAVSSPHRPEAFEAARFGIDALKASVPIWKHEVWNGGSDWALNAQHVTDAASVDAEPR